MDSRAECQAAAARKTLPAPGVLWPAAPGAGAACGLLGSPSSPAKPGCHHPECALPKITRFSWAELISQSLPNNKEGFFPGLTLKESRLPEPALKGNLQAKKRGTRLLYTPMQSDTHLHTH